MLRLCILTYNFFPTGQEVLLLAQILSRAPSNMTSVLIKICLLKEGIDFKQSNPFHYFCWVVLTEKKNQSGMKLPIPNSQF